jgi:hypothetical protein
MHMKRLILIFTMLIAIPAFGFNTTLTRGDRVGVLLPSVLDQSDEWVARAVSSYLTRELRDRGLDAFDARMDYDDLRTEDRIDADYYVEVISGDGESRARGGIGIGTDSLGVDLGVIVSHVAARMRIYDARTLEMLDEYDLQRGNTTVLPTAVGVGGRHVSAWIALPFVQYARYRAAARAVAREAASRIAVEAGK